MEAKPEKNIFFSCESLLYNYGEKINYDRLRPSIRRANVIISGCAFATAVSIGIGATFGIKAYRMR